MKNKKKKKKMKKFKITLGMIISQKMTEVIFGM